MKLELKWGTIFFEYFPFFDEGNLVVLENGFQKKTQKTSKTEITKALKIKEEYFYEKAKRK